MSHTSSLLLQSLTSMLINSIWTSFDSIMTTCVRSPKRIPIKRGTQTNTDIFEGQLDCYTHWARKTLNSSLSFGQAALTFCWPAANSCESWEMISLRDDLPGPLSIGQVSFKLVTCPAKKKFVADYRTAPFFSCTNYMLIKYETHEGGCHSVLCSLWYLSDLFCKIRPGGGLTSKLICANYLFCSLSFTQGIWS